MNYRHKLLNQQNKNLLTQKEQEWKLERQTLQQDIVNLENSADTKIIEKLKKKNQDLEKLLNDTVNLLGKEEIKNLENIRNLLQGQSLKELVDHKTLLEQKLTDQAKTFSHWKEKEEGWKLKEKVFQKELAEQAARINALELIQEASSGKKNRKGKNKRK